VSGCLEFETGQESLSFFCCNEFMLRNVVVVKILIMSSSSVKFSTVLPFIVRTIHVDPLILSFDTMMVKLYDLL
jgi:hypothetical protein